MTDNGHNTFTAHFSNLISVEFLLFIKSQLNVHTHTHTLRMSTWNHARTNTFDNFSKWPTSRTILLFLRLFYSPLHVSSNVVLIMCRSNCINTVSGMIIHCKWPSGAPDGHLQRVTIPDALLNFRRRASCILGQAFHYSPENAFYIFNQQIYFIIWYLLDRASLI